MLFFIYKKSILCLHVIIERINRILNVKKTTGHKFCGAGHIHNNFHKLLISCNCTGVWRSASGGHFTCYEVLIPHMYKRTYFESFMTQASNLSRLMIKRGT